MTSTAQGAIMWSQESWWWEGGRYSSPKNYSQDWCCHARDLIQDNFRCGWGRSCIQRIFVFIVTFLSIILWVQTKERRWVRVLYLQQKCWSRLCAPWGQEHPWLPVHSQHLVRRQTCSRFPAGVLLLWWGQCKGSDYSMTQELGTFTRKDQIVNILDFVGHMVSDANTQPCSCRRKYP